MSDACPLCNRVFERPGKFCGSCKEPIGRRDKWHVDGSTVRHDNCKNPQLRPPEQPLLDMNEKEERRPK
jgi:hypothetical protein